MYNVVFKGKIAKGRSMFEVKKNIAKLFEVETEKTELLFENKKIILKENLDFDTAVKDKEIFEQTGALCEIESYEGIKIDVSPVQKKEKSYRKTNTRQYSIYHPIFLSFFSKDFYIDVGANWKGFSIIYLFFILSLSAMLITVTSHGQTAKAIHERIAPIFKQIPVISIHQGKASIKEDQPFIIRDPETNKEIIIIDTSKSRPDGVYPETAILIAQDKMIIHNFGQEQVFDLSKFSNETIVIDQPFLDKMLKISVIFGSVFNFIALFFIFLIIYSIQILIYTVFGFWYLKSMKRDIDYKSTLSISIAAMTPIIILNSIVGPGYLFYSLWLFICFLIPIGFVIFGIKAYSEIVQSS